MTNNVPQIKEMNKELFVEFSDGVKWFYSVTSCKECGTMYLKPRECKDNNVVYFRRAFNYNKIINWRYATSEEQENE